MAPAGNLNNELGVPLTVSRIDEHTRFLVAEMGARGIGHIAYLCDIAPPRVGVVLNVGHAHVGEFGGQPAIAQAKGELVEALPADGVAVLNADDPLVWAMRQRTSASVLAFSVGGTPPDARRLGLRPGQRPIRPLRLPAARRRTLKLGSKASLGPAAGPGPASGGQRAGRGGGALALGLPSTESPPG